MMKKRKEKFTKALVKRLVVDMLLEIEAKLNFADHDYPSGVFGGGNEDSFYRDTVKAGFVESGRHRLGLRDWFKKVDKKNDK